MARTPQSITHSLHSSAQSRETLLTHARILQLLHHRSKNQHRRSVWYRHFSSFRREVNKLCADLGLSVEGQNQTAPKVNSPKPRSKTLKDRHKSILEAKKRERDELFDSEAAVQIRLLHWQDGGLLSQWYSGFSYLPSSTQGSKFAPLGLVLLAILGRVATVTGLTSHLERLGAKMEEENAEQVRLAIQSFGEEAAEWMSDNRHSMHSTGDTAMEDLGEVVEIHD